MAICLIGQLLKKVITTQLKIKVKWKIQQKL